MGDWLWSGRKDLNLRPLRPERSALLRNLTNMVDFLKDGETKQIGVNQTDLPRE